MLCRPHIFMAKTPFNQSILNNMPSLAEMYRPFFFLTNGNAETLWAGKRPRVVCLVLQDLYAYYALYHNPDLDSSPLPAGRQRPILPSLSQHARRRSGVPGL